MRITAHLRTFGGDNQRSPGRRAAVIGGTLYGGYKYDGLLVDIDKQKTTIEVTGAKNSSVVPSKLKEAADAKMNKSVGKLQVSIEALEATSGDIQQLSAALHAESKDVFTISEFITVLAWRDYLSVGALTLSLLTWIILPRAPRAKSLRHHNNEVADVNLGLVA
jgi:hypothetical protein